MSLCPHEGPCKVVIVDDAADGDIGVDIAADGDIVDDAANIELCPDFSNCQRPNEKVGWNCKVHCCGD